MNNQNCLHPVKSLTSRLGIGRSKIYQELASGRLKSVYVGSRRLVPESAVIAYIDSLIEEAESSPEAPSSEGSQ